MTETPRELHEALIRVGGDAGLLDDLELAEIGVSREHAEDYARFVAAFTATTQEPFGASGDDLSSYDYWRREYDGRHARGDQSYD